MTHTDCVKKIIEDIKVLLASIWGGGRGNPSDALALATAKEIGWVVGKKGRRGGTFCTCEGADHLGIAYETILK